MECPHVTKDESAALSLSLEVLKAKLKDGIICCSACGNEDSVWVCTACGQLSCGRYANGHGLMHFDRHKQHAVSIHCKELSAFCYLCDEFAVNDSPGEKLGQLRSLLLSFQQSVTNDAPEPDALPDGGGQPADTGPEKVGRRGVRRSGCADAANPSGVENVPCSAKKSRITSSVKNKRLVGLRNLGNTCFMSAVLQSLGNIPEFCRVLNDLPSLKSPAASNGVTMTTASPGGRETRTTKNAWSGTADGPIMTEELRKVLAALNQEMEDELNGSGAGKKVISPEALFHVIWKVVPRFQGYQQQDAHEFLRYMLDRLHTELLSLLPGDWCLLQRRNESPYSRKRSAVSSSSNTLVTAIFGGTLQSEVTCLTCNMSSKKHDPFLDLSLVIPASMGQSRRSKGSTPEPPETRLQDCLQKFLDIEELDESELWICGNCKTKQRSTKKFWIRRLPRVLCLHLKRFRWSTYSRTKIDTHVCFPLQGLDMSPYLLTDLHETRCSNAGSSLYDLAAVIVHHGSGAGSGHYTAFVVKNNDWYHFNDSSVSATTPETVALCKAYILFYIQRAA